MKKVILTILDGFGISDNKKGNAVLNGDTPSLDKLMKEFPNSSLYASGSAVGLPDGQMGNSEVGHITIGSGRVVDQPLRKINKALEDKYFYNNDDFLKAINHAKKNQSRLHIMGLLSDGGVHSHIDHLFALIKMAKDNDIKDLYIHVFLDGRDVLYNSALFYLDKLSNYLKEVGIGKIGTISGRYYAMDREKDYNRTKLCYDALVFGDAPFTTSYKEMINSNYKKEVYDEFIKPFVLDKDAMIDDNDSVIMSNFRPDRIPQLFEAFYDSNFNHFDIKRFHNLYMVTMMPVSKDLKIPYAFGHDKINNTLGEILSDNKYRVLRIAETSKYPHVTHFIDGDKDVDLRYTSKIMIPRKDVATYDMEPEMSASEVTDKIKCLIDDYDFVIVNYANGDMVGHTGNYKAALAAVKELDDSVRKLYELSFNKDILLIITADHGNCEEMLDKDGNPQTYHTTNKVPFIVCDKNYKVKDGELSDIAPSILNILDLDIPKEMTGNVIIEKTN